ncbi:hypothetical protein [uncultured Erythrobacter sp.]|uniref:hypothetical protein n=1 Tax=uncultured Erythrobacter sp. TaxID=263913 RepID=UPI002607BD08|nr:hypothetical protein [uncultured Erythrobacter sp.]
MNIFQKALATALFVATASMAGPALAQEASPVSLSGDVKAVVTSFDAEGNQSVELVEPSTIVPGDRLIFGTDYANTGDEPVKNFVVTNPLPGPVRLAPDADAELVVSVDGGKSWGTLSGLAVTLEDGSTRSATHQDVTHVRWTLAEIAPGENGRLEYPAIIR